MSTKPIPRGPQSGAPPSLEQLPLDRLDVDAAYQRATDSHHSRRIIVGMVREWKWPLCQPLVVNRRVDGRFLVLDGQHRLAGARARGDIPFLPCVIQSNLDVSEEARAFVELNTQRQRLSQADIFHGLLAAGDPAAKQTAELLEQTGWRIRKSSNSAGFRPGDLVCAPRIAQQLKTYGPAPVRAALDAARKAYPDVAITTSARLLIALIWLFRDPDVGDDDAAIARVTATLAQRIVADWHHRGHAERQRVPSLSEIEALGRAIKASLPAPIVAAAPAPAAPSPAPPPPAARAFTPVAAPKRTPARTKFPASGKAWCGQCETRVTEATAKSCASAHCKVRSMAA